MATAQQPIDKGFMASFRLVVLDDPDDGDGLLVFYSDSSDLAVLTYLKHTVGTALKLKKVGESDLDDRLMTVSVDTNILSDDQIPANKIKGANGSDDRGVAEHVEKLIRTAILEKASDIHFEPYEKMMRCRYRIDGNLVDWDSLASSGAPEAIARIKILSGLDIAEKRRPQDGRLRFACDGREIDIRVSIIPTDYGEKAVLRILDKKHLRLDLNNLGLDTSQLAVFNNGISSPSGIVLVTGPTGSGKTTTLYAALNTLRSPAVNICTVEDPIEYNLEGINQTQIRPNIGLTFATILRSLLRQDPDIIMVGEIRDSETLDIAMRAALTGHLVLSTIHTNDAISTIARLIDLGADRLLLTSTVRLIVAQRLLRTICPDCLERSSSDDQMTAARRFMIGPATPIFEGKGCSLCNSSGFKGRLGVFELLQIDEEIKQYVIDGLTGPALTQLVKSKGFVPMTEMAASLITNKKTTPMEALRELNT